MTSKNLKWDLPFTLYKVYIFWFYSNQIQILVEDSGIRPILELDLQVLPTWHSKIKNMFCEWD